MTYVTTRIKPPYAIEYSTNIPLVHTKGCEIKPIGKTGYFSEKVPSVSSKAPTYYRLRDQNNKVIDHFLSMANLKASIKRRGIVSVKAKKLTYKDGIIRGYSSGYKDGQYKDDFKMLGILKAQAKELEAMTQEMDMVANTGSMSLIETLRHIDIWSLKIQHILKGLKT